MTFDNMVVILKLVSSETVICQVISDTEKNMIVRDPYLISAHTEKAENGIRTSTFYSDWFLGSMSRIHMIRKDHVMSASIPNDETKKDYLMLVEHKDEKEMLQQLPKAQDKPDWDNLDYKFGNDVSRN